MSAPLGYNSLYLALFWNPRSYHWGLLSKTSELDTSPESLFHVTNIEGGWKFETKNRYDFEGSGRAILSLKIANLNPTMTNQKLEETLVAVPVLNGDPNFNCLVWVKAALNRLRNERIIVCYDIDALLYEAYTKANEYRSRVELGLGTWGYAVSSLSR